MNRYLSAILFKIFFTVFLFSSIPSFSLAQIPAGKELWSNNLYAPITAMIVVPDISGDGTQDVVVGTDDNRVIGIKSTTGEQLWAVTTGGTVWSLTQLADKNSGNIYIVAGTSNNEIHCIGSSPNGTVTLRWSKALAGDIWSLTTINDINGDGWEEVVSGSADNGITCWNGENGAILWHYSTGSDVFVVSRIPDITGDGKDEIIACGNDSTGDKVLCINGKTGNLIWDYPRVGQPELGGPVRILKYLLNNGAVKVLAGISPYTLLCLNGSNGALDWTFLAGAEIRAVDVVQDKAGNGILGIAVGSSDNNAYLIDTNSGTPIWSQSIGGDVFSLGHVSDINHDGKPEIIAGTGLSNVICLSGSDHSSLWVYPFEAADAGNIKNIVSIPDINSDGIEDVVAASDSINNGTVLCLSGNSHITGDSDCDSNVTLADVMLTLKILSQLTSSASGACIPGDADGDGRTALNDAILTLQIITGLR